MFPLDVLPPEPVGDGALWPLIILAVAAALVVFFIVVQLRRILRSRPQEPVDPADPGENRS